MCISSKRPRRLLPALTALFCAILTLCATVFAWFSLMQASYGSLHMDSNGIKIESSLSYVDDVNFEGVPVDADYTAQATDTARIEESGECYAGSTLHYKLIVKNISNEEDPTLAVPVDVSLSLSPIGAYFDPLVDLYLANPNDPQIATTIAANNGTILFRLLNVEYVVYTGTLTGTEPRTTYTLPSDTNLFSAYNAGQSFFEHQSLAVGQSIAVYYTFECLDPYTATTTYHAFREEQVAALVATDPTRAAAIQAVTDLELNSLVIEPIIVGSGQSAGMSNAYLNLEYFSVFATESLNGA